MANKPSPGKPPLRWLAPLILIVIAALAGLGLLSLRQDRRAAEQDAELIAKALADSLAREGSIAVADAIERFASDTDEARNVLLRFAYGMTNTSLPVQLTAMLNQLPCPRYFVRDPERFVMPNLADVPEMPAWVLNAPRELLEQMESAERAVRHGDTTAARTQFQAVARSNSRELHGVAELQLASFEDISPADRVEELRRVASQFDDATTASGLAVADLALLRAIALSPSTNQLGQMIFQALSRARFHPSLLTDRLFDGFDQRAMTGDSQLAARTSAARILWNMEQNTRPVLRAWWDDGHRTGVSWIKTEQGQFFYLSQMSLYIETNVVNSPGVSTTNVFQGADIPITIVPDSIVDAALRQAAANLAPRWPAYLSAEFEMAKQRFGATPWASGTTHRWDTQPVMATRSELLSRARVVGQYPFTLTLRLANPDLLYAKQLQRLLLFGALIVLAAGVALVGAWQLQKNLAAQLRLNEQKSNFVSSVSHELRAPIASVRLLAESLERGKISEPAKQNEYFRFIGQECRRLSSLIENVLDFSRIEQGRKQYEFEPTDLVTLTRETVKLMEPYAAEKGVRLNVDCNSLTAELNVDGRAIQQALVNLIDNAIKHSPKDAVVAVTLDSSAPNPRMPNADRAADLVPDTSHLTLSVSDHGPGIPITEHERIFERFYRLGSELRRETQGVGIGLSIVKHIVEAHGGRVLVDSKVGQGSRFTMLLPKKIDSQRSIHA